MKMLRGIDPALPCRVDDGSDPCGPTRSVPRLPYGSQDATGFQAEWLVFRNS